MNAPAQLPHGPVIHAEVYQGSDEWMALRRGLLTASEIRLLLTPTLKTASNAAERAHVYEIAAQRISEYVEPTYIGDEMLRGHDDETRARDLYAEHFAPVSQVGFITNSRWGFTLGYSPDGLVGDDGLIECKSRRQKFHVQTTIDDAVPEDFVLQVQTGLLVSERKWLDFITYCGGLPCAPIRVLPDEAIQTAIIDAATAFEAKVAEKIAAYHERLKAKRFIPTERVIEQDMFV